MADANHHASGVCNALLRGYVCKRSCTQFHDVSLCYEFMTPQADGSHVCTKKDCHFVHVKPAARTCINCQKEYYPTRLFRLPLCSTCYETEIQQ